IPDRDFSGFPENFRRLRSTEMISMFQSLIGILVDFQTIALEAIAEYLVSIPDRDFSGFPVGG
ncbi:MAG TPA: hypothetical protein V6C90_09960, partial [Coleofasciculaceae cyanobacterium]